MDIRWLSTWKNVYIYIYISTYLLIVKTIPITGFGILTNIIKKFKSQRTEQRTIGSFMRTVSLLRFFLKQLESLVLCWFFHENHQFFEVVEIQELVVPWLCKKISKTRTSDSLKISKNRRTRIHTQNSHNHLNINECCLLFSKQNWMTVDGFHFPLSL